MTCPVKAWHGDSRARASTSARGRMQYLERDAEELAVRHADGPEEVGGGAPRRGLVQDRHPTEVLRHSHSDRAESAGDAAQQPSQRARAVPGREKRCSLCVMRHASKAKVAADAQRRCRAIGRAGWKQRKQVSCSPCA